MWFKIKIETKIVSVGVITLILSFIGVIVSLFIIIKEEKLHNDLLLHDKNNHNLQHVFNVHLDKNVIDVLTAIFLVFSSLAAGFSVLLIIGIKKNNKDFVIAYLGYGILITIVLLISAILEFLQGCLPAGIISSILAVIYICCLIPVYEGYEMMANGLMFGNNPYTEMINEDGQCVFNYFKNLFPIYLLALLHIFELLLKSVRPNKSNTYFVIKILGLYE